MNISSKNFEEEVLNSRVPVLVDFWASWCGPCKMMSPVVEEIANEMEGKAKVCKVNVDDEQELAIKYGIMSIPTFLIFKEGVALLANKAFVAFSKTCSSSVLIF